MIDRLKEKISKWKLEFHYTRNGKKNDKQLLFDAIEDGRFKLAKILITGKLKVHCKDASKATPLTLVCRVKNYENEQHRTEFVKFLLRNGARFDIEDKSKKCALDYVVDNDLEDIRKIFAEEFDDLLSQIFDYKL